ncbi:MAG: exodeoxyribonuclease VII large subunit [Candidatus Adiutrix sp.]|jgi:exodeoxyribonuclease VII large subunit|nr:exodeoxyribonuclease VII large subunit [Candidatus Adiutrix sp.]
MEMTSVFEKFSSREVLTPTTLAARIQAAFDDNFSQLWVEGEIAELNLAASGHAYFVLKDSAARLKAVMWKGRRAYAGAALAEGLAVLARGRLGLYPPRGDFQLVVDYLEPQGEGALKLAFEKMKKALAAEGFFAEDRKRPLPYWPARVALVTSPAGAAAQDFLRTALTRRPGAAISLYQVRVQGPGAAQEIAQALTDLNAWGGFDLIVLTRGGGSLADLWAFNEEQVVRALAASRTVTLAAIGHSTDLTLAEMAADARAITPTAAAEAVFRDQAALKAHLTETGERLTRALGSLMAQRRERLEALAAALYRQTGENQARLREKLAGLTRTLARFEDRLGFESLGLDQLAARLTRGGAEALAWRRARLSAAFQALRLCTPAAWLAEARKDLAGLDDRRRKAWTARLDDNRARLALLSARLGDLSPQAVLKRGYALVTRPGQTAPVTASRDLSPGEAIQVRLADGGFISRVEEVE